MGENETHTDLYLKAEIKLRYDLHVPQNPLTPKPLLIAVHGYGAHKRYMMREAKLIVPKEFAIASVQGPYQHFRQTQDGYRVGFGWLTDYEPEESVALHHRFLNDIIDIYVSDGTVDQSAIYLYGFSQACALNFRYALTYPDRLKGLVGVSGGIPGDIESNPIYKPFSATALYLYGDADEFYPQEKFAGFDLKLTELLPNYRSKQYHARHEITDEMRADIRRFLQEME